LRPSVGRIPYPVTPLISAFGLQEIVSVEVVPIAKVVTSVAQELAVMAIAPRADVPLAMV